VVWRIINRVSGCRRPFETWQEARMAAHKALPRGHEDPSNILLHLKVGESARLSDYPALFWLEKALGSGSARRILDLGGSVGNMFYCYRPYLEFPSDLVWTVHDLPKTVAFGRSLAKERNEARLRFTDERVDLSECDLALTSGSLHYLEPSLVELLEAATKKPRWVLVNRAPLSKRHTYYTVQKAGHIAVACRVERLDSFVLEMEQLGYELMDQWTVTDRRITLPLYPDYSVEHFSGFFFKAAG
jgi:putative methyltransferase (TIGR04325 family)